MTSRWASCLFLSLLFSGSSLVHAMPKGGHVKSGHATFSSDSKSLVISTSDKALIHWDKFSIASGELTRFVQPGKGSVVLNRVMGGNPSEIFGTLEANGKVLLINPNGIFVSKSGVVNVGSFIASTLDILEGNALDGGDLLFSGISDGKIVNLGRISAWDGDVVLMAASVENGGMIEAPYGTVGVGVGQEILLSQVGGERLFIRVGTQETNNEVGIDQAGLVQALQVELKSKGNPYALAIRHRGKVDALAMEEKGGRVLLVANEGKTEVSGEIVATNASGIGGDVSVLGDEVGLFETTLIDVSGERGGGTVLLGGDFQGSNPLVLNARQTVVKEGARILGNACKVGNGGRLFVWSRSVTAFYGDVSVQGGMEGGDGGLVALLGDDHFDFRGTANRLAAHGKAGMLILDPTSITIADRSDANIPKVTPFHPLSTSSASFLNVSTLLQALEGGDVIVQSAGGSGLQSGDVILNSELRYDSDFSLTLRSFIPGVRAGDVLVNAPIVNLGDGGVVLDSSRDINVSAPIEVRGFEGITLTGGRDIRVCQPMKTGGYLALSASEEVDVLAALDAKGGMDITSKGSIDVIAPLKSSGSGIALNSGGEIVVLSSIENEGQGGIHISSEGNLCINSKDSASSSLIHSHEGSLNIVARHGDITIVGGKDRGAFVDICSDSAPITINATEEGRGIHLQGGTAEGTHAKIHGGKGSVALWSGGGIQLSSGSSGLSDVSASIVTAKGSIRLRAADDITVKGGSAGPFSNPAKIASQGGNISMTAKNAHLIAGKGYASGAFIEGETKRVAVNVESLSLLGGMEASESSAYIHSGKGSININTVNDLILQGGSGPLCHAEISSSHGPVVFNNIGGDLRLVGGSGDSSYAQIGLGPSNEALSGITFYSLGGDVVLQGGSSPTAYADMGTLCGNFHFPDEGILGSLHLDGGAAHARIEMGSDLFLKVHGVDGIVARKDAGLISGGALNVEVTQGVFLDESLFHAQGDLEVSANSLVANRGTLKSDEGSLFVETNNDCLILKESQLLANHNVTASSKGSLTIQGVVGSNHGDVEFTAGQHIVLDGSINGEVLTASAEQDLRLDEKAHLRQESVTLQSGRDIIVVAGMEEIGVGGITLTGGRDVQLNSPLFTKGHLKVWTQGNIDVRGSVETRNGVALTAIEDLFLRAPMSSSGIQLDSESEISLLADMTSTGEGGIRVLGMGNLLADSSSMFSPAGTISLVSTHGDVTFQNDSHITGERAPILIHATEPDRMIQLQDTMVRNEQGAVSLWSGGEMHLVSHSSPASIETATGDIRLSALDDLSLEGGGVTLPSSPATLRSQEGHINLKANHVSLIAGEGYASGAVIEGGSKEIVIQAESLGLLGGKAEANSFARIHTESGPVTIDTKGDLYLEGGNAPFCYAEISSTQGPLTFNSIGGDVSLIGGSADRAYAQIGSGRIDGQPKIISDLLFYSIGGDVMIRGGTHPTAYAQIGHSPFGEQKSFDVRADLQFPQEGILGSLHLIGDKASARIGMGNACAPLSSSWEGNLLLKVRGHGGVVARGDAGIYSVEDLQLMVKHGITLSDATFRARRHIKMSAETLVMEGGVIESREGNLSMHVKEASFGTPDMKTCVQCSAPEGNLFVKTDIDCQLQGGADDHAFVELLGGKKVTLRSLGSLSLQGGTGEGADASIAAAFEDVELDASRDITLSGTDLSHAYVRQHGGGGGDLTVVSYGDVKLGKGAFFENLGEGELNVFADRDLSLCENAYFSHFGRGVLATAAGRDMLLSGSSQILQQGLGNLFIVSGRHTVMKDTFSASTTTGKLTVVVDHFLPGHPIIGDGSFIKTIDTSLFSSAGTVAIYTARRGQNSIEGVINGQGFVQGPEYEDNENERWLTFFQDDVKTALDFFWDDTLEEGLPILLTGSGSSSKSPAYMIYYKDGVSKSVSWNSATISRTQAIRTSSESWKKALETSNRIARAESEALQDMRTLTEFLYVPKRFLVSYDATSYYRCCDIEDCSRHFDAMLEEYEILRRKYRTYNTKKLSHYETTPNRYYNYR